MCNVDHIKAHAHTFANSAEVLSSRVCGCCYCERIFPASEVAEEDLMVEPGQSNKTVLCPYCGIDAVFGDASGYEPTQELLHCLFKHFF